MVNWGIIGYGRIAQRFIQNLAQTDGHLYAIASRSHLDVPSEVGYQDYEDLLNDPKVDIVYIALPHKFHYDMIIRCIRHHKAVLCEKPMVLTVEQMESVIKEAKEHQVLVMEALKSRFIPGYMSLKKDMEAIEVESVECGFCYYVPYHESYLFDKEQGGALNDVGSYSIGFVLDAINSKVVSIESKLKKDYGVDLHFNAHLTFENGVNAHVEGAMDEKKENVAIIKGKLGTITAPYFYRPSQYTIEYKDGRKEEKVFDPDYDMRYQIIEMHELYAQNKIESSLMSLSDSLAIVKVMEQIRKEG